MKLSAKKYEKIRQVSNFLFYESEEEKNKPVIKKTLKKISNICSNILYYTMIGCSVIYFVPSGEQKTQQEIKEAVELLNADDSYYHNLTLGMKHKMNIVIPKVYTPFVVPYGTRNVDIVTPSNFNDNAKQAIKDTIKEYNSVLDAMKKGYRFNYCEDKAKHLYSIDVKLKDFTGIECGLNTSTLVLFNGYKINNQIHVSYEYAKSYKEFRTIFSHELLHTFGIGDQYLVANSTTESIMSVGVNAGSNYLEPNDIKYLFATLYDVKTQDDVSYVNSYINYHMETFNTYRPKTEINDDERDF